MMSIKIFVNRILVYERVFYCITIILCNHLIDHHACLIVGVITSLIRICLLIGFYTASHILFLVALLCAIHTHQTMYYTRFYHSNQSTIPIATLASLYLEVLVNYIGGVTKHIIDCFYSCCG